MFFYLYKYASSNCFENKANKKENILNLQTLLVETLTHDYLH